MARKVIQNEPTPIEEVAPPEVSPEKKSVCTAVAERVFERVMGWHPLKQAAELAGELLIAKVENDTFFEADMSLTEKQQDRLKSHIYTVFREAAGACVAKIKNYEKESADFIGRVVVEELMTIVDKTLAVYSEEVNRGAMIPMTAVEAKSTNEDRDEIKFWKSKGSASITIPTRGVFTSTNCLEKIKSDINFLGVKGVDEEVS